MGAAVRSLLVLTMVGFAVPIGSGTARAGELDGYLWNHRPLLVFAPSADDARLIETLVRIESSRCEFTSRDMVLAQVLADGTSTLDGRVLEADGARQLADRYGVRDNTFAVLLIGKDGAQKWRVDTVPNLQTVYAVIDGMPMRGQEMSEHNSEC
ncbi:DUF4174 domain-containing protein [Mycolicibacterium neoaurum]|uniref:DUF4174 domain-containing protein n=1 Tax=Mycolicibacterium neoaurum TaxID=1795 RepID=UPI00248CC5E1|nr:DUF4174 domain-containing protein [Mycolicibacterium neoaurum]WBP93298.1 DUF4174 domain-containing protein [Mycolicibacterium neoaurum]WBS07027.1 DUF4174 domain-containing protein [Mycolicibacterium neoaurum]